MQSLSNSAIADAEKLLAADPGNLNALLLLGRAHMASQRYPEARRLFEQAAAANPKAAKAHFMLGFCAYVDNDFRLAIEPLSRARQLNPKDANTALYLGLSHQGLAEPNLAKPYFEAALQLSSDPEIRLAYARSLLEQGNRSAAEPLIAQALRLAPRSRDAHYEMARLRLDSGSAAQAAAEAELALQLPGSGITDRQVHFLLAKAYSQLGDAAKAAAHRKAFEAIPPRLIR
ncbi:MAG: tetratricopeptide repeat protein [Acidobacteria bacterium]|nr:tetratricopeptide repeat protein [Acidobacteriota bacterium]